MNNILLLHIRKFAEVSDDEYSKIVSYFEQLTFRKKEIIVKAGEKSNKMYFILKGCVHAYFIDDSGTEKSVQFGLENWWITNFQAFHRRQKTDASIQAVEASEVLCISYDNYQELLSAHPLMERYFRNVYEIAYGAVITRLKYIYNYSKEEVFFRFREQYPEFVNRVPQYILATYLGLTPEYLSKLRAKKVS